MGLAFDAVSFAYAGGAGVLDVNLKVAPGELVALIGASGSGKTTLLKLAAGFLVPSVGTVRLGGKDVTRLPPRERGLGIVFQSYALFPHMTLLDNVGYGLKTRGVAKAARHARAQEMLAMVGLADKAGRTPATLSGGQQQRVALARALAFDPAAILLDEPLSALDASLRVELRDEIRAIQRRLGVAALHVTHDQEEALSIADRVAVMIDGKLVQVAAPAELYDRPVDRRVAAFVGHANLLDGTVEAGGTVRVPFGALSVSDLAGFKPGDAVTVLIRPEALVPGGSSDAPNRFAGALSRDRFLGSLRRYDFRLGDTVLLGETGHRDVIDAIHIPPAGIRLLPR